MSPSSEAPFIRLPRPKPHQVPELLSPAREKHSVHGRQWGKTYMGLIACLDGHGPSHLRRGAIQGGTIAWIAKSYKQADEVIWPLLKGACRDVWEDKDETHRSLTLPGGGSVIVKSGDDPDSLPGPTYDGVVFDEAALQKRESLDVLSPTLAVRKGWTWCITSPRGKNWYYERFIAAQGQPDCATWRSATTTETVSQEELDRERKKLGSFVFSQEYLAEFVTPGGGFFKEAYFRYYLNGGGTYRLADKAVEVSKCRKVTTVDLAASVKTMADYTVVSTFAVTPQNDMLMLDCIRMRLEGPDQVPMIRRAYERWRPEAIYIEKVGYQLALIQAARRDGLPIRELARDKDKVSRASLLQARMEGGNVWLPHDATWLRDVKDELLAFPEGEHDDIVDTMSDGAAFVANNSGFRVWS